MEVVISEEEPGTQKLWLMNVIGITTTLDMIKITLREQLKGLIISSTYIYHISLVIGT